MALDIVDAVWSAMRDDEFYSPDDLANNLKHPVESVTRVLDFLTRYDFTRKVAENEMIYEKTSSWPSPSELFWAISEIVGNPLPDNPIPDNPMR